MDCITIMKYGTIIIVTCKAEVIKCVQRLIHYCKLAISLVFALLMELNTEEFFFSQHLCCFVELHLQFSMLLDR